MKYLGLDLGTKTLGISISDKTNFIAMFYKSIKYKTYDELILIIKDIINIENISKIILGFPKNMNNSIGESAKKVIEFKELLEKNINIEIILQDERLTTVEATSVLVKADISRKKRKKVIDGLSAVIILQIYLDKEKNNGKK